MEAQVLRDDDIDVRPYVRAVARRWRIVRDAIIVAVGVAYLATQWGYVPQYEAVARVAMVRVRTQVTFDERVKTVSSEMGASGAAGPAVDAKTRRSTLASLVWSYNVAKRAADSMGERLPESLRDPNNLLGVVQGRPAKDSDIIEIAVTMRDPVLAAEVANAWASAYEVEVNRVYSQSAGPPPTLKDDRVAAKDEYEKASDAVNKFLLENSDYQIERQIDDRKDVINALQKGRQEAIAAVLGSETVVGSGALTQYLTSALNMASQPTTKQVESEVAKLNTLYAAKAKHQQLLEAARTISVQASAGSASAATSGLALQLLKMQIASSSLPSNVQLQLDALASSSGAPSAQTADAEALVQSLESRQKELDIAIEKQSASLVAGSGVNVVDVDAIARKSELVVKAREMGVNLMRLQGAEKVVEVLDEKSALTEALDRLTGDIRQLAAQLAASKSKKEELVQARDRAWQTYNSLSNKSHELTLSAMLPGSEVVFAAAAGRPSAPVPGRTNVMLALAAALGLVLGIAAALIMEMVHPKGAAWGIPWMAPMQTLWRWRVRRSGSKATASADIGLG